MRLFSIVLLGLVLAGPAQADLAMSTSSDGLGDCTLQADTGLIHFYVVHWPGGGATGVRYRLSTCESTLMLVTEATMPNVTLAGDALAGATATYPTCLTGAVAVQVLTFLGTGTSPPDSGLRLYAHPDAASGQVEQTMCDDSIGLLEGGGVCIKPTSCLCNQLGPPYHNISCGTIAVEGSTWGRVKALYR